MTTDSMGANKPGLISKVTRTLLHEVCEILPATIFFLIGFNFILFTKRLILEDYLIQFTGFTIATVGALIVGKAVLVADAMPYLRRFDNAPLAQPTAERWGKEASSMNSSAASICITSSPPRCGSSRVPNLRHWKRA